MPTSNNVSITPLGGLGEIGLNCQLWECDGNVVMIDCGLMFPDDAHLGVDVLIPHFGAVNAVKDSLCGIILTHAHEDHIGALPWLIPNLKGINIYGSRFTLALVEHKLKEHHVLDYVNLCPINENTKLKLGKFTFNFFPVCHSIPEGFALAIETPIGKIIHSGDFKIDPAPLSGSGTNLKQFSDFAHDGGIRLLLSDSTNIMRDGHSLSEREVKDSLANIFAEASGRIIITLFSSHIQRIQEVFDLSDIHNRSVIISGKSLATNIEIAKDLGFIKLPSSFYNAYNGVPTLEDDKVVLIVTGAQGEPLSALSRMVFGNHKQLNIKNGDTILMSSRMIPGNAKAISRLINKMYHLGAEVIYESVHAIHASGHAHKDELKSMIQATNPQLFVPIHGEYRHLVKHARLANECGIKEDNIILLTNGQPLTIDKNSYHLGSPISVEYTIVDGKGVGDIGAAVLKERHILGDEGIVIVSIVMDEYTGHVLSGPDIISKGFIFEENYSHLLEDAKCLVIDEIEKININGQFSKIQDNIRSSLRSFFKKILERDPLIIPIITYLKDNM